MSESRKAPFFGVVADPQSYVNILYLLLGLPLGIAYFVVLVTGISLGFGLAVIWVGLPILLLVFLISWALCQFERVLTNTMLKEDIPPMARSGQPVAGASSLSGEEAFFVGVWRRLKAHLSDRLTWTGMVYLLLKLPVGIATFTIAVTLVSVSIGLIAAPAYMWASDPFEFSWLGLGDRSVDPFPWSWILTPVGIPALFISLHLMNLTAFLSGRMARVMLGKMH
tara:strand:- start:124 stop:795 length:672 start_codon:yes stop_codon:yes gene_type:complete